MTALSPTQLRPIIRWTLLVMVMVAIAPWLSGGQEPVAMVISCAALLLASILVWMQPEVRQLRVGPMVLVFFALIGFATLSLLWSVDRYSTVLWVAQWLMAGLAFWMAYILSGEPDGRRQVIDGYAISAAVFCIVAVGMYFTSSYGRLIGSFYWPNPAAAYLIPAIVIALDKVRSSQGKLLKIWIAGLGLFTYAFLLADSRGATLVLLIVAGVYLLIVKENRKFWIRLLFIVLAAFILSIVTSYVATKISNHDAAVVPGSRVATIVEGQDSSVTERIQYSESALAIWFAHPAVGTGAGTYASVHPTVQKDVLSASTDVHDVYLQVLSELGIVGAMLLAAVILFVLLGFIRGLVAVPDMLPVGLGAIGLLLHFGLDIDAQYPALLALVGVLFGLTWRGYINRRASAKPIAALLALIIMVPLASAYTADANAQKGLAAQNNGSLLVAASDYEVAHSGVTYNPTYLNAEGINLYSIAATGEQGAQGGAAQALALARLAIRQDPDDAQNYQLEGRIYALEGKPEAAEVALKNALRLDPHNEPVYALDLATVQQSEGDNLGAVATANAMLNQYPADVLDNRLADSTLRPTLADLYALVGNIAMDQGDLASAKRAADEGLAIYPQSVRVQGLSNKVKKLSVSD